MKAELEAAERESIEAKKKYYACNAINEGTQEQDIRNLMGLILRPAIDFIG
jgi:hypothetical protein